MRESKLLRKWGRLQLKRRKKQQTQGKPNRGDNYKIQSEKRNRR